MRNCLKILSFLMFILFSSTGWAALRLQNTMTGISGPALENAKAQLTARQTAAAGALTTAQIRRFYAETPGVIKKAIEPYGYFKAKVTSRLTQQGGTWTITSHVIPGNPLHITRVDLRITGEGANDRRFQRLRDRFPIKNGQVLEIAQYNKAKDMLFDLASRRGYLAAQMKRSEIKIDLSRYTAVIILYFDTGPRYRFGMVRFSNTPFDLNFLRRFMTFREGSYYSDKKLQKLQEDLSNSNYFKEVVIHPQLKQKKGLAVPIQVGLQARPSQHYIIGAGYGTDTGVRGRLGIELRRLTPTGHHFYANIKASPVQGELDAHYIIPGRNPATDRYDIGAAYARLNQDFGDSTTKKLTLSAISVPWGWQQTLSLTLQNESFQTGSLPEQSALWLIPSVNWLRVKSDDPLRPKRGYRLSATLLGASRAVLADEDFFQASMDAKQIYPLTKNDRFIARATLGYTAISDLDKLPLTLQFRTGGSQSVRGYGYKDIGPGRYLTVGSVELQHRVYKDWYASVFFDAGTASDGFTKDLKRGAGVGVVWLSPIGAIELTYARALDLPSRPWRFQFTMGPEL